MKVFLTGGSGAVGSAVLPYLVAAGHEVYALARSDASAAKLKDLGAAHIVQATLNDVDKLAEAAKGMDAIVHLAFDHSVALKPGGMDGAAAHDRVVIKSMADNLHKGAYLLVAAGTIGNTGPDETSGKAGFGLGRGETERLVTSLAKEKGLNAYNLRLPFVHYNNRHHFVWDLVALEAKKKGYAAYVDDGSNVVPAGHANDIGAFIVVVLKGTAAPPGSNLHAIAEPGVPTKSIVEAIAKKLGVETRSVKAEDVASSGFAGLVLTINNRATSELTRRWTGWEPKEGGLVADIEQNYSFDNVQAPTF